MTRARDVANLIGSGNYSSTTFTATAGQTAFTISHTQGFVQVFMNGLLLDETVDYTSNGSAVTLTSGAAAGDEIEVVAYNTFSVGDALNQAAADTRYVNTSGDTMTGALKVDAGNGNQLTLDNGGERFTQISYQNNGSQYAAVWYDNAINVLVNHAASGKGYVVQTGGATDRLVIDSSGRVTMPYQPIIAGTMGTAMTSPTADTLLSFNNFFVNRGITFNSSTKRFTVPTAGVYSIMMTPFTFGGAGAHRVFIGINTDAPLYTTHRGHFYTNQTTYDSGALHSVVELAANDYIVFRLIHGKLYNISTDLFNEFSICKIA